MSAVTPHWWPSTPGLNRFSPSPTRTNCLDILPRLIWHQEEPFGSTSIAAQWYVMQTARRNGITVILDGQGSDEVLAGYHPFFSGLWAGLVQRGQLLALDRELHGYHARHGGPSRILLTGALGLALPAGCARPFNAVAAAPGRPGSVRASRCRTSPGSSRPRLTATRSGARCTNT